MAEWSQTVCLLLPHTPGCVASFAAGAELAVTALVTTGRAPWKPEPARPERALSQEEGGRGRGLHLQPLWAASWSPSSVSPG